MGTLIKQECFKLFKKKSTFIIPIIIMLLMVVQAIISKNYDDVFLHNHLLNQHLVVFHGLSFLLIIQASTIISMEFYHGTIKIFSIENIREQALLLVKLLH